MKLQIGKTKTGRGIFAGQRISKGARVIQLKGSKMKWDDVWEKIIAKKIRLDDPFQVGEEDFIILDEMSRLFNHSCHPNAGIRNKNELFALQPISIGDEITFDYSTTVCGHSTWTMRCRCGAKNCRSKIGNIFSLPKQMYLRYQRLDAIPLFIAKEYRLKIDK